MNHTSMILVSKRVCSSLTAVLCAVTLTGCLGFLRPVQTTRHFVLSPIGSAEAQVAQAKVPGFGIGRVKIPVYLFESAMAVRKGTNEVAYLQNVMWAERLDAGVQRVLAANLSSLMPTRQIRTSAWNSHETAAELYVTIEQFDTDSKGCSVLTARWRIVSAGGGGTLSAGDTFLSRQGASPESNPGGAVATLSALLADFSRELAAVLEKAPADSAATLE